MSDIAIICAASVLHAVTFAAGVLIGTSLRKDTRHDSSNEGTKEEKWWHDACGTSTKSGAERRGGSSARKGSAAGAPERAPIGRSSLWE